MGRLTPELETAIFRIVQEGLTNVHRHSQATECTVVLQLAGEVIRLELEDNGVGLPDAGLHQPLRGEGHFGVGLSGMAERARQLGGCLVIGSRPRGCLIQATFPARRP